MVLEVLMDAVVDTVKLIPFLFLTYLAMEYLEDRAGEKTIQMVEKTGKAGPLIGAAAGILPQCGFSAAASSLYSGGVITAGTLLAIFLSTSDEMLPIFISESVAFATILQILLTKAAIGAVTGFVFDISLRIRHRIMGGKQHIHELCEQDHCHCEEGSIWKSAIRHTLQITAFIFVVSLLAGFAIEIVGEQTIAGALSAHTVSGVFLCALVGLIPNCAASVMLTELYLMGLLGYGQMMAGLLVGAGVGLLVLFRTNRHRLKDNLKLTLALYLAGVVWGLLLSSWVG